jgi:hypothetical protein
VRPLAAGLYGPRGGQQEARLEVGGRRQPGVDYQLLGLRQPQQPRLQTKQLLLLQPLQLQLLEQGKVLMLLLKGQLVRMLLLRLHEAHAVGREAHVLLREARGREAHMLLGKSHMLLWEGELLLQHVLLQEGRGQVEQVLAWRGRHALHSSLGREAGGRAVQHTGGEERRLGLAGLLAAPRQHHAHVLAAALEHLDVALLLPLDHVAVVPVVGGPEGRGLAVHLDESLPAGLALGWG